MQQAGSGQAQLEAEIGMGIRQDERLANVLRRQNNRRIGQLRSKLLQAVRAELDYKAKVSISPFSLLW